MNSGVVSIFDINVSFIQFQFQDLFGVQTAHEMSPFFFSSLFSFFFFFLHKETCPFQSRGSCFIRMTEGARDVLLSSRLSTYSLNWEESTPPPHEPTISNPLCCNLSSTCKKEETNTNVKVNKQTICCPMIKTAVFKWIQLGKKEVVTQINCTGLTSADYGH